MLNKLKSIFTKPEPVVEPVVKAEPKPKKPRKPKEKKVELSDKEKATMAGEPYVNVVKMAVDPEDIHNGEFELDWNDIFVARLVKAGYMMKPNDTDAEIVDRWFQNVCRHVVMETWEQEQAIKKSYGSQYIHDRDIGDGRREIS